MLFSQVGLQLLVLLLCLRLVRLKLLSDILELAAECLSCLISALHGITKLGLQVGDLGLELNDFLLQLGYVALFHLDLLAKASNLALIVADLVVSLTNCALKSGNLRQQLLFSALASRTHVLLLVLDLT